MEMVGRNVKKRILTRKHFLLFSALALSFFIYIYVSSKQLNDSHRPFWPVLGKEKEGEKTKPKLNKKTPNLVKSMKLLEVCN